jgi:hypothetical protein
LTRLPVEGGEADDERKINMPKPFEKKRVTQVEREAIVAKARRDWDSNPHSHLLARSDIEYLEAIENGLVVTDSEYVSPQPMDSVQKSEFEHSLRTAVHLDRMYGDRMYNDGTAVNVLDKAWQEKRDRELAEFLAPARRAESALDKMIEEAVNMALRKVSGNVESRITVAVQAVPERQAITPLLRAAVDEDPNSDCARFLAAFASADEPAMRAICRELLA